MSDSIRTYGQGPSPRSERKRSREHDDADERRARRRNDEYGHSEHRHKRRSRSPCQSGPAGRRDYEQDHRHGRRGDARHPSHDGKSPHRHTRSRSKSPAHHRHHNSHPYPSRHVSTAIHQRHAPKLPYNARSLSRSTDFDAFRPLFARYLDVQKQIDMARLDEREARGRWKSFVSKWNNNELAEGWYRPETFEDVMLDTQRASNGPESERRQETTGGRSASQERRRGYSPGPIQDLHTSKSEAHDRVLHRRAGADLRSHDTEEEGEEEDDDDYGPTLPPRDDLGHATSTSKSLTQTKHGPGIPTLSDLTLRSELEALDRDDARALLGQERKVDRTLQKERLNELVPRADPGSQARKLEKRREVRDANTSFANAKSSNEMSDLPDAELMGADAGGVEEYKRLRHEAQRKKTEREVRREEILRAKREEREDRMKEYREREAQTVDMLREIAKSRFG
ncbi:hypothetical protein F4782DRAFT_14507 [Xylaria castorea]|nr:hypothetical protein F4782DRAFT_14507 [Xylaria castorea]